MVGTAQTIYDYVIQLLGTYTPIVDANGTHIDMAYVCAAACLLIAVWFCFRGFLMLLKGVLGKYA